MVGSIGFVVDASILMLCARHGTGLYLGRVISFLVANSTTWMLNRAFTFRPLAGTAPATWHRQWMRYLAAVLLGGGANYVVYALCISQGGVFSAYPVIALVFGAAAGLGVNFNLSHRLVFAGEKIPAP